MKHYYLSIFFVIILSSIILSCSSKKRLACCSAHEPHCVSVDDLLNDIQISPEISKIEPIEFYEPELNINDHFTSAEKTIVGIKNQEIFENRKELVLKYENISDSIFSFPLPGARFLSPFGKRRGRMHTGIDIKINRRDTVYAAFSGIVRMVGWSRGYGKVVVIRHYNGLETVYAHASKQLVKSGDRVTAGVPIIITGATGRATTDHLHFEVRVNGIPIDPQVIVDINNEKLKSQRIVFSNDKKGKLKIETV